MPIGDQTRGESASCKAETEARFRPQPFRYHGFNQARGSFAVPLQLGAQMPMLNKSFSPRGAFAGRRFNFLLCFGLLAFLFGLSEALRFLTAAR